MYSYIVAGWQLLLPIYSNILVLIITYVITYIPIFLYFVLIFTYLTCIPYILLRLDDTQVGTYLLPTYSQEKYVYFDIAEPI